MKKEVLTHLEKEKSFVSNLIHILKLSLLYFEYFLVRIIYLPRDFYFWIKKQPSFIQNIFYFSLVLIILLFLLSIFATFFYYKECDSKECFFTMMSECRRAIYENSSLDYSYQINGFSLDGCKVYVSLNSNSSKYLNCLIPLGERYYPETKISLCSGNIKSASSNFK